MSDTEKKLMKLFSQVIPTMTEREKERFLHFGDGMAFMAQQRTQITGQQPQDRLTGVQTGA